MQGRGAGAGTGPLVGAGDRGPGSSRGVRRCCVSSTRKPSLTSPHRAGQAEAKPRCAMEDLCAMIEVTMCQEIETILRKMDLMLEAFDAWAEARLERIDARFDAIITRLDGLIHQGKIIIWMLVAILILELVAFALLAVDIIDRSGSQFAPQRGAMLQVHSSTDPAWPTCSMRDSVAPEFFALGGSQTPTDRPFPQQGLGGGFATVNSHSAWRAGTDALPPPRVTRLHPVVCRNLQRGDDTGVAANCDCLIW